MQLKGKRGAGRNHRLLPPRLHSNIINQYTATRSIRAPGQVRERRHLQHPREGRAGQGGAHSRTTRKHRMHGVLHSAGCTRFSAAAAAPETINTAHNYVRNSRQDKKHRAYRAAQPPRVDSTAACLCMLHLNRE